MMAAVSRSVRAQDLSGRQGGGFAPAVSRILGLAATALILTACGTTGSAPPPPAAPAQASAPPSATNPVSDPGFAAAGGDQPVRVGLLLPTGHPSPQVRELAVAMQQAAELAMFDAGNVRIELLPRDEGSTPEATMQATQALLDQGAEVILGPLFSPSVRAAGTVARGRAPVIAFSTDRLVAGDGVYLLSFQPEQEVKRAVAYASERGRTRIAALVPNSPYGARVRTALNEVMAELGLPPAMIIQFPQDALQLEPAIRAAADSAPDTLLIAQGGELLQVMGPMLTARGIDPGAVQLLGTGLWDEPASLGERTLAGGWFAAPDPMLRAAFVNHYREVFGANPPRLASLTYDAMSLVAALAGGPPGQRFTAATLTDPNGFAGVDGIFRFRVDGTTQRGLAVVEVQPGGGTAVVGTSPRTFQGVGF